jgi:hypothetical protein
MIYFAQGKEYDMSMHANIHCMNMHEFLKINSPSFAFLEFYIMQ